MLLNVCSHTQFQLLHQFTLILIIFQYLWGLSSIPKTKEQKNEANRNKYFSLLIVIPIILGPKFPNKDNQIDRFVVETIPYFSFLFWQKCLWSISILHHKRPWLMALLFSAIFVLFCFIRNDFKSNLPLWIWLFFPGNKS